MAFAFDLGSVGKRAVQRQVIVAYDEVFAIKYFGQKLLPYWARNGAKIADVLQKASSEYPRLLARCKEFDRELMEDLTKAGGEKYAKIAALAYRECVAANGLAADANKQPLFFTKENTSNGDIATVDVFFPMDPIWIVLSPSLAKASLVHVLMYSASHALEVPQRPARSGHVSAGLRPRRWRRGDAGGGKRQHAHPLRRDRPRRRQCRLRRPLVAATHAMGELPGKVRARSGKPALHGRFHGPPRPQRESFGQGDPRPGGLRRSLPHARRGGSRRQVFRAGPRRRQALDESRRRRRPLSPGVRQAATPGARNTTWSGTAFSA